MIVLNVAHTGLFWIWNTSGSPFASLAAGLKEYMLLAVTVGVVLPVIVGAAFSDAASWVGAVVVVLVLVTGVETEEALEAVPAAPPPPPLQPASVALTHSRAREEISERAVE